MSDTSDKFIAATTDETIDPPHGPGWPDGDDWATESGYHSNLYSTQGVNDGLRVAAGKYGSGAELGDLNPVILGNRLFPSGVAWKAITVSGFSNGTNTGSITCSDLPAQIDASKDAWLRRIPFDEEEQFYKITAVQGQTVSLASRVTPFGYDAMDEWAVCQGAPACAISLAEGWLPSTKAQAAGITGVVGAASTNANLMEYQAYDAATQETYDRTNYNGGAAIGVAGRAVKNGQASIWGMYAHAVRTSGTGTAKGNAYGLEVDMNNESGEDHGAQDEIEVGTPHDVCIRLCNQAETASRKPITAGISFARSVPIDDEDYDSAGMWNGILFDPGTIKSTTGGVAINMCEDTPYMGIKFGVCAYSHIVGTQGLWITNQHATTDTVFTNTAGADWLWRNTAGGGQVLALSNSGELKARKAVGFFDTTPPANQPEVEDLVSSDATTIKNKVNELLTTLRTYGIIT